MEESRSTVLTEQATEQVTAQSTKRFSALEVYMLRERELQHRYVSRLYVYECVRNSLRAREKKCLVTPCVSARSDQR